MDSLVTIPELTLTSTAKKHAISELTISNIVEKFKVIPNLQNLKMNSDLLSAICNAVENIETEAHKLDKKIDKKEIVMSILQQLFVLNPQEVDITSKMIDFLCENKMVKKIEKTTIGKVKKYLPSFFSKKSKK